MVFRRKEFFLNSHCERRIIEDRKSIINRHSKQKKIKREHKLTFNNIAK